MGAVSMFCLYCVAGREMYIFFCGILRGATTQKCINSFGVGGQPELSSFFGVSRKSKMFVAKKVLNFPDSRGWGGGHLLFWQCHHKRRNNYLKTQLNDL